MHTTCTLVLHDELTKLIIFLTNRREYETWFAKGILSDRKGPRSYRMSNQSIPFQIRFTFYKFYKEFIYIFLAWFVARMGH